MAKRIFIKFKKDIYKNDDEKNPLKTKLKIKKEKKVKLPKIPRQNQPSPEGKKPWKWRKRIFEIIDLHRESPLGNKLYATSHYRSSVFEVDRETGRRLFQKPASMNDIRYFEKDKDYFEADKDAIFKEVADEIMSLDKTLIAKIFSRLMQKIADRIKAGFTFRFPRIGTFVTYHQPERKYFVDKKVYNVFHKKFLFFIRSGEMCRIQSYYTQDIKMEEAIKRGKVRDDSLKRGQAWYLRTPEEQYTPIEEYRKQKGLGPYDENFSYKEEALRELARKCKKEFVRKEDRDKKNG